MTKELKKQGLANVEHFPAISDEDLEKIYSHLSSDLDDAQLLQYKVFLDIMLHFGRRGRENLSNLTRRHFAVTQNEEGTLYVYKVVDERTKNHQDDNDKSSDGRMYEIKESARCPVRSFVKYIRRLNPRCDRLFQQARTYPKDGIYYDNVPLGHNKLGTFMNQISIKCGLNKVYTNHSCRATTVNVLDAAQFPSRHIMSVTGHKSESSLKTYSGKTDENTKKLMSEKIAERIKEKSTSSLRKPENDLLSEILKDINSNFDLQPLTNSQEETLLSDICNDDGIDEILQSIPVEVFQPTQMMRSNVNVQSKTMNQFPMSLMYNCNNVTINYHILPKQ